MNERRIKVFIVEDESFIARCICKDLMDLGADTLAPVPRGEVAVEIALREKPDLILMDIRLAGGMDGIEAAQLIQEKERIPIVFMSGFATDYIKKKAEVVHYLEFFEKPVTIHQLEKILSYFRNN